MMVLTEYVLKFFGTREQASWTNDSCFAFPALTALAATWNPEMGYLFGKSIGEEARYRKKDILLGPGVNIYRTLNVQAFFGQFKVNSSYATFVGLNFCCS